MTQENSSNQQFRVFLRPRASYRTDYQTQFIRVCEQGACEHDILPLLKLSVGVKTATIVKATDTRTHELPLIVVLYVRGMTLQKNASSIHQTDRFWKFPTRETRSPQQWDPAGPSMDNYFQVIFYNNKDKYDVKPTDDVDMRYCDVIIGEWPLKATPSRRFDLL